MAPQDTVTYQKVNQDALCFFDLPGEIREVIYQECLELQDGMTIHLIDEPDQSDESLSWLVAKISSKYHTYICPSEGDHGPEISDLILRGEAKAAERMGLLRVCKAIHAEVDARVDAMNNFNVLASSEQRPQSGYHGDLDVTPIQVLTRIKRLNLSKGVLDLPETWKDKGKHWWLSENWQVISQDMVRLERLVLQKINYYNVVWFLLSLGGIGTAFEDTETRVYINVADVNVGCFSYPIKQLPLGFNTRRITIPALKELVLEGQFSKLERARLACVDLSGTRFKLDHLGQSGEIHQHEVIWVGHKRGRVGIAGRSDNQ